MGAGDRLGGWTPFAVAGVPGRYLLVPGESEVGRNVPRAPGRLPYRLFARRP
jgi:hypothetical protein